jgi:hypothetical protein
MQLNRSFLAPAIRCVASILQGTYVRSLEKSINPYFGKLLVYQINLYLIKVQALQRDSPQVAEYLSSIGYESFALVHFPARRFGHDTSNIVKSTNSM